MHTVFHEDIDTLDDFSLFLFFSLIVVFTKGEIPINIYSNGIRNCGVLVVKWDLCLFEQLLSYARLCVTKQNCAVHLDDVAPECHTTEHVTLDLE